VQSKSQISEPFPAFRFSYFRLLFVGEVTVLGGPNWERVGFHWRPKKKIIFSESPPKFDKSMQKWFNRWLII